MVVFRCGLDPSLTRRGRCKGRCDACSAGVPPAMVVYRRGLVPSSTRRGCCKGRCDACSAGVPPAMVVYRCGLVPSPNGIRRRSLPLFRTVSSSPAFWTAVTHWRPGGPASHHRRGRAWVAGRAATTPMARRRPASWPEEQTASRSPGGARCDIVRWARRSREVAPAQYRTRHPDGGRFSACPESVSVSDPRPGWADIVGAGFAACPVRDVKSVGRIRESAGRSGLMGFPAAAAATATATVASAGFYRHRPSGPP